MSEAVHRCDGLWQDHDPDDGGEVCAFVPDGECLGGDKRRVCGYCAVPAAAGAGSEYSC